MEPLPVTTDPGAGRSETRALLSAEANSPLQSLILLRYCQIIKHAQIAGNGKIRALQIRPNRHERIGGGFRRLDQDQLEPPACCIPAWLRCGTAGGFRTGIRAGISGAACVLNERPPHHHFTVGIVSPDYPQDDPDPPLGEMGHTLFLDVREEAGEYILFECSQPPGIRRPCIYAG